MVTVEDLDARAALIGESAVLAELRDRLTERAEPVLARMPHVPRVKALLSRDGGVCAEDGAALVFDPWSPDEHRCSRCGAVHRGGRYDRFWARFQHLWIAERAAHVAAVGVFGASERATRRANELLAAYREYSSYPNTDNVLGPARLFFSTYLESIWLTNFLAAATLLREAGALDEEVAEIVSAVADDAASLIGEFDEGFSNRQTWNNAALTAVAVWFEDSELAARAIEGETGLLSHLAHGFARDGSWHEGENYHLFALQGLLTGMRWARTAGVDAFADAELAGRLAAALRVPTLTALPDLTFPARKDSRFGVSLAQPMYLELWESGLGALAGREVSGTAQLGAWLTRLYRSPAPAAQLFESWLHEAGEPAPEARSRSHLSWNALLGLAPELGAADSDPAPESILLDSQGLAILRSGDRYVSVECGPWTGGHGHPDRLHLTLHDGAVHWLPDFGTGSYVDRDLFWYRSTLAHNAPMLDGESQAGGDARCEAFDVQQGWGWVRARWDDVTRTVVAGPEYVLDVVELAAGRDRRLELPWHPAGALEILSPGTWGPTGLAGELVSNAEVFAPAEPGAVTAVATDGPSVLALHLSGGHLVRAVAPGAPGTGQMTSCLVQRGTGRNVRLVTVLAPAAAVSEVASEGSIIRVTTAEGTDEHAAVTDGWDITRSNRRVRLAGLRAAPAKFEPLITRVRPHRELGQAVRIAVPPALDGTLAGFDDGSPLHLDHEDQYRRSEEPYAGSESFSATAWVNWDDDALYVAVHVVKPDLMFREPGAPPLNLDNELDDINSDGLQVYVALADYRPAGALLIPEDGGTVRSHRTSPELRVGGRWAPVDDGYLVTFALTPDGWDEATTGGSLGFDLIVNEMRPGRERRAGQLVWSGGGGWVWLRGDRQDPSRFGVLDLA